MSFKNSFNEDDIPSTHEELNNILESAFFTPGERGEFMKKVKEFMRDKSIGLDLLK